MTIVFYNANEEKIYICSSSGTQVVSTDNTDWINQIPNEDILYVTNGHFFTKQQFREWLVTAEDESEQEEKTPNRHTGFMQTGPNQNQNPIPSNKKYIHPTSNGTVLIEDINTPKFPTGVKLSGKWDFVEVDAIGADNLENSPFYRSLVKKGKLEEVDEQYYQENAHKKKTKVSPADAALDKILIKDDRRGAASKVADSGGLDDDESNIAIPIYIDG